MVKNIGIMVSPPRRTCDNEFCPFHGQLSIRGRSFSGTVESNKAAKMIVVTREYPQKVSKYKRFQRSKSKVHAFLPECIDVEEGRPVKVAECRPLSKTISFVVIEGVKKDGV